MKKHTGAEPRRLAMIAAAAWCACLGLPAQAMSFDTGESDVKVRWDNTFKYSTAARVKERSSTLVDATPGTLNNINQDDGDRNFSRGLISNRVDWLTELDVGTRQWGLRVSGAGWYDSVYNGDTDYTGGTLATGTGTSNNLTVPANRFTPTARRVHGRNLEGLDAFVYGKADLGGTSLTVRLGRHSLVYGESLFFGANGIANAQGPVDLVKLLSVPGTQFKEVLRPTEQVSTSLQLTPQMSLGAYYQFRWHASRVPENGSYFSNIDVVGQGAQAAAAQLPGVGPVLFVRSADQQPKNSGQGGLQLRYRAVDLDTEFGFYAARYHEKLPAFVFNVGPVLLGAPVGELQQKYQEGVRTFGASFSKSIGELNLAGEASVRRNQTLNSNPAVAPVLATGPAIGNSVHAQVSGVYLLPQTALSDSGSLLFEAAWHRLTGITQDSAARDPGASRDAASLRMILEPQYFQVISGLDVTVPMGLGVGLLGRSPLFAAGWNNKHVGDMSLGLHGVYDQVWQFGIDYFHFFGPAAPATVTPAGFPVQSFGQSLKDRDFVSFNIKRTF